MLRKLGLGIAGLTMFSGAALAETWNGAIIDVLCRPENVAAGVKKCPSVRQCMLSDRCKESGYGIVLSNGRFLKFDHAGSAKALELLQKMTKETDLKATVTGTLKRDVITVEKLEIE
jgi:hypothetical protein